MKTKMRRRGGEAKRDEDEDDKIRGEHGKHSAARSPRKDGGGVGADSKPFSSAKSGTSPPGRHTMSGDA